MLICSAALTQREIASWRGMPNVLDVIQKPFNINALIAQIDDICAERAIGV